MTPQELVTLVEHGGIAAVTLYLYFVLHKDFERLLEVVIQLATEMKATREQLTAAAEATKKHDQTSGN